MLFDKVFINPNWKGQDDFPSCIEWKTEVNGWLKFIKSKGQLIRYIPRLNANKTQRDEALSEILSAYILETKLNYKITDWERKTVNDKDVDFIIEYNKDDIHCEVKSPGWESELTQKEQLSGRTKQPKYKHAEVRSIAPWQNIRYTIQKSYEKFLPNCMNMSVINPDLFGELLEIPSNKNIEIALYENSNTYGGEKGYFETHDYENVGGLLIVECILYSVSKDFTYRYKFFPNEKAMKPFYIKT